MEMGFDLNMKQTQRLVVTPDLMQSLSILQYSSQELEEFLRVELERNPLLEMQEIEKEKELQPSVEQYPMDWKEYFRSMGTEQRGLDDPVERDMDHVENTRAYVDPVPTLYEHLMLQLEVMEISHTDRRIAAFIIENLDDNGYLMLSKHEIALAFNIERDKVTKVLRLVQSMDPSGVGARSLRECLLIQLKQRGLLNQYSKAIVLEHLKDIAQNQYQIISRRLAISVEEVKEICQQIKDLDPKPGRPFAGSNGIRYILPDIVVEKVDDEYVVQMKEITAPRLHINKVYQSMLSNPQAEPEVTQFLTSRLQMAHMVIKAIEQRRSTIHKIVTAIMNYQKEFLESGVLYLKPLTLKMIAEETQYHESTVSRAVQGKYIQTPRGLFELKFFFDSGVMNLDGKAISSQSIKQMLRHIIRNEDVLKPYSDQGISDVLAEKGISISRRTVGKYREELGIPSSSIRRRF